MRIDTHWPMACVDTSPRKRLPFAPKLYADETLHSWIVRLAHAYAQTPRDFLFDLGWRSRARLKRSDTPEVHFPPEFFAFLSSLTGVPRTRLKPWDGESLPSLLRMQDRTGFCARCWAERKRADAAYLSYRWAEEWSLACRIHRVPLWDLEAPEVAERWTSWPTCFEDRATWTRWSKDDYSSAWTDTCRYLEVEPNDEWDRANALLFRMSELRAMLDLNHGSVDPVLLVMTDLVNCVQINGDRPIPGVKSEPPLPCAIRDIHDSNLCVERTLIGPYRVRLLAVLVARRLFNRLAGVVEPESRSLMILLNSARHRLRNDWWLRRRLNFWPKALRAAAVTFFYLNPRELIVQPTTHECRDCLLSRRNRRFRMMDSIRADPRWRCEFDPWFQEHPISEGPLHREESEIALAHYIATHFER